MCSRPVLVLPWSVPRCCLWHRSLVCFLDISHFLYLPLFSLGFIYLIHSLSRTSLGDIFFMYSWILVVSSWIVALTFTHPPPPSFCFVYSLRVLDKGWNIWLLSPPLAMLSYQQGIWWQTLVLMAQIMFWSLKWLFRAWHTPCRFVGSNHICGIES